MHPSKAARERRARVDERRRGIVIECLRVHGTNDGDVVRHLRRVGQQFGKFRAGFTVPAKLERRADQIGNTLQKCKTLSLDHFFRHRFAGQFLELWFCNQRDPTATALRHER